MVGIHPSLLQCMLGSLCMHTCMLSHTLFTYTKVHICMKTCSSTHMHRHTHTHTHTHTLSLSLSLTLTHSYCAYVYPLNTALNYRLMCRLLDPMFTLAVQKHFYPVIKNKMKKGANPRMNGGGSCREEEDGPGALFYNLLFQVASRVYMHSTLQP